MGQQAIVTCKVGQVKPVRNLEIHLTNNTSQLIGKTFIHDHNVDGLTETIERKFDITFSR